MDVLLSKLGKDAFTVFTSFQNKYLKAKSLLSSFSKIWHCPAYKCWGDQLSSCKYEELLGILIDHKWTFELSNIIQKINQKIHSQARISKYIPQIKLKSTMKALVIILHSVHWSAIIFIIFWDFLRFYQIFLSPQVKRCEIISYKHSIYKLPHESCSLLTIAKTLEK